MSASWKRIGWNETIGRPNCRRSFAYAAARSYAPCARPSPIAATEIRPPSRISMNCANPRPRSPRRFPSGTAHCANESSRVSDARQPSLCIGPDSAGQRAGARAAVLLGNRDPHQSELRQLGDELVRKAPLAVEVGCDRRDARLCEVANRRADQLVLFGELEVQSELASSVINRTPYPVPPATRR